MKIKSRTIGDPASSASSSSGGSYLYWQLMEVVRRAATTSHAHAAIGSSTVVGVAIVVMSFGGVTASTVPNITVVNVAKASQVYLYESERREPASRPGGRPASSNPSSCNCEVGLGQSDLSTDREDPAAPRRAARARPRAPASPIPHRTQCTGKPWGPTHRFTSSGGNGWTQTQHRDDRHAYHPKGGRGPQTFTGPYPIAPPQRGIRAP